MPQFTPDYTPASSFRSEYWSNEIPTYKYNFTVPTNKVNIEIKVDGVAILSDIVSAHNDSISVALKELVSEEMKIKKLPMAFVEVSVEADSGQKNKSYFRCFYANRRVNVPVMDFMENNFLSLATVRKLPLGWKDKIFAFVKSGEDVTPRLNYVVLRSDGYAQMLSSIQETKKAESTGLMSFDIEWPEVDEGSELVSMYVEIGDRMMTWYRIDHADVVFSYDNAFGVSEFIASPASVSRKTSIKSSLAKVDSELRRYDVEEAEEVTVTFPPAKDWEMQLYAQIESALSPSWVALTSPDQPKSFDNIVISSAELVDDDGGDSLPVAKITFRAAADIPEAHAPVFGGVFSEQYTKEFK